MFCAAGAVARSFPFGPRTRSINDMGNQYVPYHAHLWDLLHGRADGGILVNWQSGFGASFLPDLGTYLTSPSPCWSPCSRGTGSTSRCT